MARPKKTGFDYFPCDVNFNDSFRALEELHGNDGHTWMIKFWQAAYKTDNGIVDLSGIRGVIGAKTCRISADKQKEIIRDGIDLGVIEEIEPDKYTSEGIRKRMVKIIGQREYDRNYAKNELSGRKPADNCPKMGESKVKKRKEKNNTLFDDFWKLYPKKTGKGAALKIWNRQSLSGHDLELITRALEWQIKSEQWIKENGQYIPNPATYLDQTRWMDEPVQSVKKPLWSPQ